MTHKEVDEIILTDRQSTTILCFASLGAGPEPRYRNIATQKDKEKHKIVSDTVLEKI